MLTYESTVTITASRESIWAVIADVERWHEWTPTMTRVEPISSGPIGLGARFKVVQPKLRPAVWTVADFRPGYGFTWESRYPGTRIVAEHWIYPSEGPGYNVSLRVGFGGLFGAVIGKLKGALTKAYLSQEAESLKRRVETAA
jgi:hypothetical protein